MSPGTQVRPRPTGLTSRENRQNRSYEEKQMTTAATLLGASSPSSSWDAINWRTLQEHVQRLQMRIAKATREGRWEVLSPHRVAGSSRPWQGLSRVMGNYHARFLEGWGRVTVPSYSTRPHQINWHAGLDMRSLCATLATCALRRPTTIASGLTP